MSIELPGLDKFSPPRKLRTEELSLILKLVENLPVKNRVIDDIKHTSVFDLNDGGMGSIVFRFDGEPKGKFGQQICEAIYRDDDDTVVSITINLDQKGRLFELDIWKTDNSALVKYPDPSEITVLPTR